MSGGRPSLVSLTPTRPALLFHFRLEDVAPPVQVITLEPPHCVGDRAVVAVLELLDDLERPTAIEHVPSDDIVPKCTRACTQSRVLQEVPNDVP